MPDPSYYQRQCRHWPRTTQEARSVQESLRDQVQVQPGPEQVTSVAGLDVSYPRNTSLPARAAGVIMAVQDFTVLEQTTAEKTVDFPYIPGFLSFREVPCLLAVLDRLSITPEVIICDGQGLAHPQGFGLACHLGVLTDLPVIGVAKSRLFGKHYPVEETKGAWQALVDKSGKRIGAVLRTRTRTQPVIVSVGHKMDLDSAVPLVLSLCPKYRIPEPIRRADSLCAGAG